MPLGIGSALFAVVSPVEKTNLCTNPSGEFGTSGWTFVESAVIGTSSAFQQFGAWSFDVAPGVNGTCGVQSPAFTASNGSAYSVQARVRGVNGITYRMAVANSSGAGFVSGGTLTFTGGGTWHHFSISFTEPTGASRTLVVTKNASADVNHFYVDGVQFEQGSITTYIDGDQPGGTWTGAQHISTSTRTGQYRGGGSVIALADLGLQVDQMIGVGMPPIENSSQSYAITDGAQFQRQRAASRQFTLTAKPIIGTSLGDFHITRRTLIDAFKPDLVTPQQPIRFLYVGGQGTVQYDAYYENGLELGNMDGVIAEDAAIKFVGYDPYWYFPTQQGTTLTARTALGSVNYVAARDSLGRWGTLGVAGLTFNAVVRSMAYRLLDGNIYVGGDFGSAGGTANANYLASYDPSANRFGTLNGTITTGAQAGVQSISISPAGSIFFVGSFLGVGGTTSRNVGQYSGAYGTLGGSVINVAVDPILTSLHANGTFFIGGNYNTIGGTTHQGAGFWTSAGFGTLTNGTVTKVTAFGWGLDNKLYMAGSFATAGGTANANSVASWNGTFGTLNGGLAGVGSVLTLAVALDGRIYASGSSSSAANCFNVWNGVQWSRVGGGITEQPSQILRFGSDGNIFAFGMGSVVQQPYIKFLTVWNGAAYLPLDITINNTIRASVYTANQALYVGGDFNGTFHAASVVPLVNTGRSVTYPTLRLRNLSSGTARVFQLLNTTTGNGVYFNLVLQAGEMDTLDLIPGERSFTSTYQGNIFNTILPGSNLATLALAPGTNYISFFADNDSLEASFFWQPRSWSIDGGTIN